MNDVAAADLSAIAVVQVMKLDLQPGDILVVRVPDNIDANLVHACFENAMQRAGVKVPVIIGPKAVEMEIVKAPKL